MKKILTPVLAMALATIFSLSAKAQNLVPNPSFEIYDTCPSALITDAVGWNVYRGSPDYFNSCNNVSLVRYGIPSNEWGFQYPRNGNAYAGLCTFDSLALFREYIGIQLSESLNIGQKYFASFFVSKAVNSPYFLSNPSYGNIMTNKIGLRVSTIAYDANEPTDNYAQIYTDSIITDTTNWVKISGSFIADSEYKYLSIGNFFSDSATSYLSFYSSAVLAYYYIDDVCISTDSLTCSPTTDGILYYNNNSSIQIFPNPARDWIAIEGRNISKISLFDVLENLCFSTEVSFSSLEKIDVSSLNKGIYFLYVQTSTESIIKKIILQ